MVCLAYKLFSSPILTIHKAIDHGFFLENQTFHFASLNMSQKDPISETKIAFRSSK